MTIRWTEFLRPGAARLGLAIGAALAAAGCATAPPPAPESVVLPVSSPFPESLTTTADGTVYVSSITNGGVLKVLPGTSAAVPFFLPGEHGTRSTFGLLADDKHGMLWLASNDASGFGLKGPSTVEGSWIKGFDLKTGALKVSVRVPVSPSIINDFAVADDGTLYMTNTAAPQILRLKPGAEAIEVFAQDDAMKGGLDGIAFGKDGNLYANTFVSGEMFRIGVNGGAAGPVTKLKTAKALVHPDGLRPYRNGFIMVEGAGPLTYVTIEGDTANFQTMAMLAEPTSVSLTADRIWISEGHISYLSPDKKGQLPESFNLRSMPLPKN